MFCSCVNKCKAVLRRFKGVTFRILCFICYGTRVKFAGIPILEKHISIMMFPSGSLKVGKNISARKNVEFRCSAPLQIGDNCFFNNYCTIVSTRGISIGNDCLFGENVHIYDSNHVFYKQNTLIRDQGSSSKPIKIGNNVWIGTNVCVLKGASIGDNSVIGANSVISSDIPANSLVKSLQRSVEITPIKFRSI